MNTDAKFNKLKKILKKMGNVLIGFSAGTDSTFLVKTAMDVLGDNVLAVTAVSDIHFSGESDEAASLAGIIGVRHMFVQSDEMNDETFVSNPSNRCYICKKNILSVMRNIAEEKDIPYVLDGTNADDRFDHRPGMRAVKELGVRSPLFEVGLTKDEIRALSRELNLPTWEKPAMACLATRIPFGSRITTDKLKRIERAEAYLSQLGFRHLRVRDHEPIARIEIDPSQRSKFLDVDMTGLIIEKMKMFGYTYVTLDLEGYRAGSMNESVK